MRSSFYLPVIFFISGVIFFTGCTSGGNDAAKEENVYTYKDPEIEVENDVTADSVSAEFWGLPAIEFKGFQPQYHIKASTNNGELENRTWNDSSNNIFEYGQILFNTSHYKESLITDVTTDLSGKKIVTVNEKVLFAEEYKLFKRTSPPPFIIDKKAYTEIKTILTHVNSDLLSDFEKSYILDATNDVYTITEDVSNDRIKTILETGGFIDKEIDHIVYDTTNDTVIIQLDHNVTGGLTLADGDKIAVFATNRPYHWHNNSTDFVDYSIVDSLPVSNVSLVNQGKETISMATGIKSDRANTRIVEPVTLSFTGDSHTIEGTSNGWFQKMVVYKDKIVLSMKYCKDGDTAKMFWDAKDPSGKALMPFMLFWIAIDKQ